MHINLSRCTAHHHNQGHSYGGDVFGVKTHREIKCEK